jgi:hypothetical protein
MIKEYDKGDAVTVSAVFKKSGVLTDPTAVFFKYTNPAGTTTTLQYTIDVSVVRDSLGTFHLDIDANASGIWKYRVHSTGTGQAAAEGKFKVKTSLFA